MHKVPQNPSVASVNCLSTDLLHEMNNESANCANCAQVFFSFGSMIQSIFFSQSQALYFTESYFSRLAKSNKKNFNS